MEVLKLFILNKGNLFCCQQELIEKLLSDILLYYVYMGACQFLRDFPERMPSEEECGTTETSFAKAKEEQREK